MIEVPSGTGHRRIDERSSRARPDEVGRYSRFGGISNPQIGVVIRQAGRRELGVKRFFDDVPYLAWLGECLLPQFVEKRIRLPQIARNESLCE
jgi:hypothetical protein